MKIEGISKEALGDIEKCTRSDLFTLRLRFVQLWSKYFAHNQYDAVGKMTRASFMNKYQLLKSEMVKRRLIIAPTDIDLAVTKQSIYGLDVANLPDMVIIPDYISLTGGFVRNPKTAEDVDVVVRTDEKHRDESLELKITRALGSKLDGNRDIHFIYSQTGPHSSYIPLYHSVLLPAEKTKKVEVKESYDGGKTQKTLDEEMYYAGLDIWSSDKRADFNAIKKHLEGVTVLDIGCGTGRVMKQLADSGFTVEGVDKSSIALKMCAEKHLNCVCSDLEKDSLDSRENNSVDNVIGLHVLEHLDNPEQIISDSIRVAKSKVIFIVPLGKRGDPTHKQIYENAADLAKLCGSGENIKTVSGGNNTVAMIIHPDHFVKAKLAPFGLYTPPKPTMSHITEAFKAEDIQEWAKGKTLVAEPKLNGFRAVIEKKGSRIRIKTEGGKDLTKKFPEITKTLSYLPEDFILDASMGIEKSGKPLPRIKLMTLMADKPALAEDENVVFTMFDMPYYGNQDYHTMYWSARRKILQRFYKAKLERNPHFDITPTRFPKGMQGINAAFTAFANLPQSEGIMLKDVESTWSTDGSETGWAKIKKEVEIKVKVLEINKTGKGAYVYNAGVFTDDGHKEIKPLGKTFSTKIKASVNDIITVGVEEILPEPDSWISWLGPRVIDVDPDRKEPYDVPQIVGIAERGGILQKARSQKAEGNINYKLGDTGRGVLQIHIMGIDDEDVAKIKAASATAYAARHNPDKLAAVLKTAVGNDEAAHLDMRLVKHGDDHFEGGEIFIGNLEGLEKVDKFDTGGKLRFHFKTPHAEDPEAETVQGPVEWMRVGEKSIRLFPPGTAGARSKTHGAMMVLDKFTWKHTLADNHAKKFLISGSKLIPPGEYLIAYVPVEEGRVWMISRPLGVKKYFDIAKADQQIVSGIVYSPNDIDAQGEYTSADEIEKAMYSFMEKAQNFGVNHEDNTIEFGFGNKPICKVLESYIVPATYTLTCSDGRREEIKKGSWWLTVRVIDKAVWKMIKEGKITGYSMGGKARS